jgi:hypothetical protein
MIMNRRESCCVVTRIGDNSVACRKREISVAVQSRSLPRPSAGRAPPTQLPSMTQHLGPYYLMFLLTALECEFI